MPPTQSPIRQTWSGGGGGGPWPELGCGWGRPLTPAPAGLEVQAGPPCRVFRLPSPHPTTHLPIEGHALLGPDEVPVGEVGPLDDRGDRLLVLGRGGGQQGQGGQGRVVLAAGQTAFVVAVGTEARGGNPVRAQQVASGQPKGPVSPAPNSRPGAACHPERLSHDLANLVGTLPGQALGRGLRPQILEGVGAPRPGWGNRLSLGPGPLTL